MQQQKPRTVLRTGAAWRNLRFYQKSQVLYHLTFAFCNRFLPQYGDRTKDQMIQAARSCKQNIVEGCEDGKTSTEMELKLLNVARSSVDELREDFKDYIKARRMTLWTDGHPRYRQMQEFTRRHNSMDDYTAFFDRWTDEEMANVGLTLCYQVDVMMNRYLKHLETEFVTEGGIKERMHAARTGYRNEQDARLKYLERRVAEQELTITGLRKENELWRARYNELKEAMGA
nr:four helix bundle suffix domain-containing protein [Xylanibacter caecicola]